ncbi:FkbM family methyltransferase [Pseudochelatococcus sp. G4_1912]|uniref:FkbM family methyltransferase n=1 Tax=Pseudochelatococcus sp. G4_1912 TaxID=3114288 RepID=UPI0039C61379
MPTEARILSYTDCEAALDEVRSLSRDYTHLWREFSAGESLIDAMAGIRRQVDPDNPYFFGEMANGIRFAGDARDFPSVLHALYPECNAHLIGGLIHELGDRKGDILDIGTNIGVVAASLARHLGERGQVHAFEPSPDTARMAAATIALNGLRNVTLTEAAISETDGEITFHATPGNSAIASAIQHDFSLLNEWREINVACLSIDSIIKSRKINHLLLIKVDVEGHEISVLRGGLGTFRHLKPSIIFEYSPVAACQQGLTSQEPLRLINSTGPFAYRALVEPRIDIDHLPGLWLSFPLAEHVRDQVNVFATPI